VVKLFTVKFIKLPKKFKEFSEINKVYSLGDVSQFYFEATALYPELANKQIRLEIHDSLENQPYAIDVNIHLNLSLADLIIDQINKTIAKTDDNEQLADLKKRVMIAFKTEIQSFDRGDFIVGATPKIEELPQEELSQDEQVAKAISIEVDSHDANLFKTDIATLALDETEGNTDESVGLAHIFDLPQDISNVQVNENFLQYEDFPTEENVKEDNQQVEALGVALPTAAEFLKISEFKAVKKLVALKEDISIKMSKADSTSITDLEQLLAEIEEYMKDISKKINEKLTAKINEGIEKAHAEIEDYKQKIEFELSTKFNSKNKQLEAEIKQNFETEKQALKDRYEKELEFLEAAQEVRQVEWLITGQEKLDIEYKHDFFKLCKDEIERIENTALSNFENAKFEFDMTLIKDESTHINSLLDKHTKIMNQTSQPLVPDLKTSDINDMSKPEFDYLSPEMISPITDLNSSDENLTNVVSSLLDTKLNEMQVINKKINDEYQKLIAELTAKTIDLELKLENNTSNSTEVNPPRTNAVFKLILGTIVAAIFLIGLFTYVQIQNVQELNDQLITRNQGLDSQLLSDNELEIIGSTTLTFSEYLSNADYLLAAMHHPEEVHLLVRHLFEREDVDNLRTVLEVATETYGWLNVAILEEDHYSIIREFENLLPSEQAQLTIRQQNAVSLAYAETDLTEIYGELEIQVPGMKLIKRALGQL